MRSIKATSVSFSERLVGADGLIRRRTSRFDVHLLRQNSQKLIRWRRNECHHCVGCVGDILTRPTIRPKSRYRPDPCLQHRRSPPCATEGNESSPERLRGGHREGADSDALTIGSSAKAVILRRTRRET